MAGGDGSVDSLVGSVTSVVEVTDDELVPSVVSVVEVESSVVSVVDVEVESSVVSVVDDDPSVIVVVSSEPDVVVSSVDDGVVTVGPDGDVVGGDTTVGSRSVVVGSGNVLGATGPGPVLTVVGFAGSVAGVVTLEVSVLSMAAVAEVEELAARVGGLDVCGSVPELGTKVVRIVSSATISMSPP